MEILDKNKIKKKVKIIKKETKFKKLTYLKCFKIFKSELRIELRKITS